MEFSMGNEVHLETLEIDPSDFFRKDSVEKARILKDARRKMAKKYHPDVNKGEDEKFKACEHAYSMLVDKSYRHGFDQKGKAVNLDIRINIPLSGEDLIFGTSFRVSVGTLNLSNDGSACLDGTVEVENETFEVEVPRGSLEGFQKTYRKKGHKLNDERGNVLMSVVLYGPLPEGVRPGSPDVCVKTKIPLITMIKGGEITVTTLWGIETVKVPPGTKIGDQLIISREGIKFPPSDFKRGGDHIVEVDVLWPSKKVLKTDKDWAKLQIDFEDDFEDIYNMFYLKEMARNP